MQQPEPSSSRQPEVIDLSKASTPVLVGWTLVICLGSAAIAWFLVRSGQLLPALFLLIFALVVALGLAQELGSRRLGRVMRAPTSEGAGQVEQVEERYVANPGPIPPFAVQVLNEDDTPTAAPETLAFLEERQRSADRSAETLRRGADLLWACFALLLLLATLLYGTLPSYAVSFFWQLSAAQFLMRKQILELTPRPLRFVVSALTSLLWLGGIIVIGGVGLIQLVASRGSPPAIVRNLPLIVGAGVALLLYRGFLHRAALRLAAQLHGERPFKLLFLWVFGTNAVLHSLLQGIGVYWAVLGSMQVLRGRGYMGTTNELLPAAFGRARTVLVETPEEVRGALAAFRHHPHWSGRYYTNSLLCHDNVWQLALHKLLVDTDVAVINLGGFSATNTGCVYEIGQLINYLPTERFLLLVDETTDLPALLGILKDAWNAMAPGSPNRGACEPLQLYRVQWLNREPPKTGSREQSPEERARMIQHLVQAQAEVQGIAQLLCDRALRAKGASSRSRHSPTSRLSEVAR